MKGRWANLSLAVFVPLATVSGFGLFLVAEGPVLLVAVLHGTLGLGLLALVPWKGAVIRRGLRRRRRPGRDVSVLLMWVVLLAVFSGVAHVVSLTAADLPVTTMQLHVGAGLAATLLTLVHAVQRPIRLRRTDWGRRTLLRSGAVVAGAAGLGLAATATGAALDRSGDRRLTGSFRTPQAPVTQWLFDAVPTIDPATWRLTLVTPAGERQLSLTDLGGDEIRAVLDCTGGWWTEQAWGGTRLSRVLPEVATGTTVQVTSATGYARRLPLGDDLLLATTMAGVPLSAGHGAPVRLVVPGRRGYHWVKWVDRVEVLPDPWWVQPPLPLR